MIIEKIVDEMLSLKGAAIAVGAFISLLWIILLGDMIFSLELYRYGVYPRELNGLWGILSAPLIHSSWSHLLANTPSLFILGTLLLYAYPKSTKIVLPLIYLGSGLGVWLFARSSFHLGASGLTHGLMFFLFVIGVLRRDKQSIALSLIVFFLYGGMIWGIFPQAPGISFESHFFGAAMGVILAVLLRNYEPLPPEKKYDWEDEP
ncbi:MAG: rhomboid family intramembrane serine protease [Pseudomonadota bacterium]